MEATLYSLSKPIGVLRGSPVVADPPDDATLQGVLASPLRDPETGGAVTSEDGERWMRLLPGQFRSPYLWAAVDEDAAEDFSEALARFDESFESKHPRDKGKFAAKDAAHTSAAAQKLRPSGKLQGDARTKDYGRQAAHHHRKHRIADDIDKAVQEGSHERLHAALRDAVHQGYMTPEEAEAAWPKEEPPEEKHVPSSPVSGTSPEGQAVAERMAQMPLKDYEAMLQADKRIAPSMKTAAKVRAAHRTLVAIALKSGKKVPAEVLKDYPDLTPSAPAGRHPLDPASRDQGDAPYDPSIAFRPTPEESAAMRADDWRTRTPGTKEYAAAQAAKAAATPPTPTAAPAKAVPPITSGPPERRESPPPTHTAPLAVPDVELPVLRGKPGASAYANTLRTKKLTEAKALVEKAVADLTEKGDDKTAAQVIQAYRNLAARPQADAWLADKAVHGSDMLRHAWKLAFRGFSERRPFPEPGRR